MSREEKLPSQVMDEDDACFASDVNLATSFAVRWNVCLCGTRQVS